MKSLKQKIGSLAAGTKYKIPSIESRGELYRVTENAIQLNCVNNGCIWIPKSQILDIDEITGEIQLTSWIEGKINKTSGRGSGAY